MNTIRDIPLNCPDATYVQPEYKEAGMRNFTNLVRTMLNDYGVYHVQFNTISNEVLKKAQENPDQYRSLLVRVAGYSAQFTNLSREMQDSIMARNAHEQF